MNPQCLYCHLILCGPLHNSDVRLVFFFLAYRVSGVFVSMSVREAKKQRTWFFCEHGQCLQIDHQHLCPECCLQFLFSTVCNIFFKEWRQHYMNLLGIFVQVRFVLAFVFWWFSLALNTVVCSCPGDDLFIAYMTNLRSVCIIVFASLILAQLPPKISAWPFL